MTQAIDPIRLKAAAEHLEWVLQQYPHSEDVQGLLRSLATLIEDAKARRIAEPLGRGDVPGAHSSGDGLYAPYKAPDVDEAYTRFRIELRGGLTGRDGARQEGLQALWEFSQGENQA